MENTKEDRLFKRVCVAGYFMAWLIVLSKGLQWPLLAPAISLAGIYGAMHYYEMTRRGHCALSADSTAMPAAFLAAGAGALVFYFAGIPGESVVDFLLSVPMAWIGGHVVVFSLVFLLDKFGIIK